MKHRIRLAKKANLTDPQPGESKDDFMGRCVPMMVDEGKEQDEAVAACSNMFDTNTQAQAKASADAVTAMSVQDGEAKQAFMERCGGVMISAGKKKEEADAACSCIWNDHEKSNKALASAKPTGRTAKLIKMRAPVKVTAGVDIGEVDGEKKKGPPQFQSVAYSGGIVPGYTADPPLPHDYIIDLSGMSAARSPKANLDHKPHQRVGQITAVQNNGKQLTVAGVLSAATSHRDEVVNSAKDGFEWEVSIEGDLANAKKIGAGKTAIVNGRRVEGPLYVFGSGSLTGIAFVSQGADEGNSVSIAASAAAKGRKMELGFKNWLVTCGIDADDLTDEHRTRLQRAYESMEGADGTVRSQRKNFDEEVQKIALAQERRERIQTIALEAIRERPLYRDEIQRLTNAALDSDIDVKEFQLELIRNLRGGTGKFSPLTGGNPVENDPTMIQAAICLSAGLPNIEKHFSADVLNGVDMQGMRNFSLQQLLIRIACANGFHARPGDRIHRGNIRTVLEYCFPPVTARLTGWSTINLPEILGAVANKELLAGYMEEDQTWREIASVKPVNNFHAVHSYRMLDDLEYELIGPAGDIKHGTLGQETYTRQARTYAKMLGLTREDIINDDLGAFDDLRARLGRGAAQKFNNIFWAAFMNNASFFTAGRTNYLAGSTTNLGVDGVGLAAGVLTYRQMKTPVEDGQKRIGVSGGRPTIILVPPELEQIATAFFSAQYINTGGSATATGVPNVNTFQNLYRPVVQDRLSDSAFTGYSQKSYYLFGQNLKPMVVSFLNGQQTPTVESSDADFSNLGIQFRGYHDFGADLAEYLSGVKIKGEV